MDQEIIASLKVKMQKAMQALQEDLGTIRTGRATPALVENLVIPAYNNSQHLKLKEMATITTEGPRIILISPFDPTVIRDIERGIGSANMGLGVRVEGNLLRINIPSLTAERRDEYIKLAHAKLEGGRVMIRQARHDAMNELKRNFEAKQLNEDENKRSEKEIQNLTDDMMAEIDLLKEKKEEELRQL